MAVARITKGRLIEGRLIAVDYRSPSAPEGGLVELVAARCGPVLEAQPAREEERDDGREDEAASDAESDDAESEETLGRVAVETAAGEEHADGAGRHHDADLDRPQRACDGRVLHRRVGAERDGRRFEELRARGAAHVLEQGLAGAEALQDLVVHLALRARQAAPAPLIDDRPQQPRHAE